MAVVCKHLSLTFIENPCTASMAITEFLQRYYDGVVVGNAHRPLDKIDVPNSEYRVVTIRNPFDKVATQYTKHNYRSEAPLYANYMYEWCWKYRPSFEEYIVKAFGEFKSHPDWAGYFPSQDGQYGDWCWLRGTNCWLLYEDLQGGIDSLWVKMGLRNTHSIPRTNVTVLKTPYRSLHTPKTIELVYENYAKYLYHTGYRYSGNVRQIKV